jgi:predicted nucleotidyltransferase
MQSLPIYSPDVLQRLTEAAAARIFQQCGVLLAYLHGSHATETAHAESDTDLAVLFPDPVTMDEAINRRRALFADLAVLLGTDRIHLSILNGSPSLFRYQVVTRGQLIYADDHRTRARFEGSTYSRYFYDKPFYDTRRRILTEKMSPP